MSAATETIMHRFKFAAWRYLPWLTFAVAGCFYFYEYTLRIAPSLMYSQIAGAYHLNARSFGSLAASYYYIYIPMQVLVGLLLDRYGPRRLLTMAVFCCSIGSYFFANSDSIYILGLGRILMGLGSAFAFVGVLKFASIWLPRRFFGMITGIAMAIGMLGGIFGDFALTHMVMVFGWELTCSIVACVGLLLTIVIFILMRDRPTSSSNAKSPPSLLALFSGLWLLMQKRQIWLNAAIGCLLYLPVSGFAESWQVPFLEQAFHYSQAQAAMSASIVFLGWAIGGPVMGFLSDVTQQRRLSLSIGAAMATILLAYVLYVPDLRASTALVLLFFYGMFASVQVLVFPISYELSERKLAATAMGFTNMIVMLAGFSVYAVGFILNSLWRGVYVHNVPVFSLSHFQLAFLLLPVGSLTAVFLTFFLEETGYKFSLFSQSKTSAAQY
ncbi:MAG: MFS transporter [Gammaproteobacteria bacterium]|nr:MFS transporter [Gammaproteobacteria bacterium]